jgi:hypothetical protein
MKFYIRNLIVASMFLTAFQMLPGCRSQSTEPQVEPDLIIQEVTYNLPPGPFAGLIGGTITIKNIGARDFIGLVYVASASERIHQRTGLFDSVSLVFADWSGDSVRPGRIPALQTIYAPIHFVPPSDTNVEVFRIETDNVGLKPGSYPLPVSVESNYNNNEFRLTFRVVKSDYFPVKVGNRWLYSYFRQWGRSSGSGGGIGGTFTGTISWQVQSISSSGPTQLFSFLETYFDSSSATLSTSTVSFSMDSTFTVTLLSGSMIATDMIPFQRYFRSDTIPSIRLNSYYGTGYWIVNADTGITKHELMESSGWYFEHQIENLVRFEPSTEM